MHRSGLDVGAVIAFVMFDERVAQPIISLSQTPLNWVSTLLNSRRLEPYVTPEEPQSVLWTSDELALRNVTIRAGNRTVFERYTQKCPHRESS